MKRRQAILIILYAAVLLFGTVLFGCMPSRNARDRTSGGGVIWVDEGLEILDARRVNGDAGPVIRGVVRNTSSDVFSYTEVDVILIDAIGRPISTTSACRSMLKPWTTWNWEAPVNAEGVADFQVVRVVRRY